MKYYSLNQYLQDTYGEKLYKLSIDAGFTCPNRDGTLGTGGCIFCSAGGSGDFAQRADLPAHSVGCHVFTEEELDEMLVQGKQRLAGKYTGNRWIAYLQAYTNTYAPTAQLRRLYGQLLDREEFAGLSIGTRPDCLGDEVLALLAELKEAYPTKFIWIELGLQTANEETARRIRRGYENCVFEEAMQNLRRIGIPVVVHMILGLPGETKADMLATAEYVGSFRPFGVKLQLLHVLRGTELAKQYAAGAFEVLSMEAYLELLGDCIAKLPRDTVIHRLTGDGPKKLLIAPLWSADKKRVLNAIREQFSQGGKQDE